jgi:hypothetical protein
MLAVPSVCYFTSSIWKFFLNCRFYICWFVRVSFRDFYPMCWIFFAYLNICHFLLQLLHIFNLKFSSFLNLLFLWSYFKFIVSYVFLVCSLFLKLFFISYKFCQRISEFISFWFMLRVVLWVYFSSLEVENTVSKWFLRTCLLACFSYAWGCYSVLHSPFFYHKFKPDLTVVLFNAHFLMKLICLNF